ncbi:reverse transcriptase domain-containing protein [Tanacetum coccineum]
MVANQIRPPGFPPIQNNQNRFNQNQGNNFNQNRGTNFNQNRGNNFYQGQVYQPPTSQPPVYQAQPYQAPAPQMQGVSKTDFENYVKANDAILRNMQNQGQGLQNQMTNLTEMLSKFVNSNTASSSSSGSLPSKTVTNPKEDLKGITTRSGIAYQGPIIPTSSPKVVERRTELKTKIQFRASYATAPVSAPMPNPKPSIPYPSRRNDEKHRENANEQNEKFYEIFKDMSFEISFMDDLTLMPKFASTLKTLIGNKEKLSEIARTPLNEHCSAVILNKLPEKLSDPGRFLIPCKFPRMDKCLALADLGASINLMPFSVWKKLNLPNLTPTCMTLELAERSISRPIGIAKDVNVKVGVFQFPANFVVVDFEPDPRVPLILGRCFLKTSHALIYVYEGKLTLRVDNEAITYNLDQTSRYSDLPPHLEYAFLEDNNKLPVIIAKDLSVDEKTALIKVLKQAIAWKLSDIKGINPEFCSHKILMEEDYKPAVQYQRRVNPKIHDVIKKELCNGTRHVSQGVLWLSSMIIEKTMEVFMDDFLVFGNSFSTCLSNLEKMLKQCEDTNLALNWEKSHFMVKEGIVLGHKISKKGIEVDKAKIDVTAKLPHPTTVKGIRSFLGHAGFYRRFIKDFSKISRPMTHLLEKNTPFIFSEECIQAFQTLKKKLTEAPILIALDWDQPFELMCDASDYAIGAVLGQRIEKHFRPIHYASKTMTEAESNYTTMEKEMLVVVYAFEKFWSYHIMNKSIVYTDHSALKYLFAKKDAKARLQRWVLLLQEFNFKIIDTKGAENYTADHLSRLENSMKMFFSNQRKINENFPLETLNMVTSRGDLISSMAEIDSKEAQMKLKAGICFRTYLTKEAQAASPREKDFGYK